MSKKENFDEVRQEDSDDSQPCCSSGSGGWKGWKTVVFVVVVLAAGAVAAHSVLTNGKAAAPSCGASAAGSVCSADKASMNNPVGFGPACTAEKQVCTKKAAFASENKTCEKAKQFVKESQCTQSKQTSNCPLSNQDKPASSCCPKAKADAGSK